MTREEAERLVSVLVWAVRDVDSCWRPAKKYYDAEYEKALEAVIAALISKETSNHD